jgi:hypothetical protein
VATVLLTCLSQILALEAQIDINLGHKEMLEFVDECLRAFAEGRENSMGFPARGAAALPGRKKKAPRRAAVAIRR